MKIKPLGERILIKDVEDEAKSAGGIYLPDAARDDMQLAIIVEVGTGDVPLVPGTTIMHNRYTGISVKSDDETYKILHMNEVVAIVLD